ncbi:MAG TPA: nucleoside recognition protein [Dialister sp.]|nr:nucleoside recognition protein [Dialister sp.]
MAEEKEEKKERELSIPEYFMLGAKKGFYITVELIAPAMVMAYTLITFLKLAGIMPIIGEILSPVMGLFGLPGEASVVLLAAFFAKAAGAATAAGMYMNGTISAVHATILFPACITMGTLIGHFARVVMVAKVRSCYYPIMLATPIVDAMIAMWVTRGVLFVMGY